MLKRTTKPVRRRVLIEEGRRESHTKNQSEEIGALRSAKKQPPRRTGHKKAKATARKSSTQERKVPLKKNNTTMKKNLVKI